MHKPPRPKGGRPKSTPKPPAAAPKTRAQTAPQAVQREERAAILMAAGKGTKEVAADLGIGPRAAVSSLLDTEARLNADLHEARSIAHEQKRDIEHLQGQIAGLQSQLDNEQNARRHLQDLISKVAELVQKRA